MKLSELKKIAYNKGVTAKIQGMKRMPALDETLLSFINQNVPSVRRALIFKAWLKGWDVQNLSTMDELETI